MGDRRGSGSNIDARSQQQRQSGSLGDLPPAGHRDVSALANARADSIRHPYTAADVRFMSHMIGHHAQAIVMAGWAPTHGASPWVRTLAEWIINSQQDEIATMQQWLRGRRWPVPEARATRMKMNGAEHEMLKPEIRRTPVRCTDRHSLAPAG